MKKMLVCLLSLLVSYTQIAQTINVPPMVFKTSIYEVTLSKNITDLFIDVIENYSNSKVTNVLAPHSNRRYMLLGSLPNNLGGTPLNNTIKDFFSSISSTQWQQGIYLYPYVVDGLGNLVQTPNNLSNAEVGNMYIAVYDHDLNLLFNSLLSQTSIGEGYFGDFAIDFPFQSFAIGANNSTWSSITYGTMLYLKVGSAAPQPKKLKYDPRLLKKPITAQSSKTKLTQSQQRFPQIITHPTATGVSKYF